MVSLSGLVCISHQSWSWFSCVAGFREILRFAQNDDLKPGVILRGCLCPEESVRGFEEEEIFLAEVIAACEKCGFSPRKRKEKRQAKARPTHSSPQSPPA